MNPTLHMPPSAWAASAPAAPVGTPLSTQAQADVVVIGGGFTGLSTALHAAEAGARVVVLEAAEVGWGASGRNGGQVNPGFAFDPPRTRQKYPAEVADRMIRFVGSAPDLVFDLVRRHALDCEALRPGWLQPAHRDAALPELEARCAAWQALGVDMRMLDGAQTRALIGSDRYTGALLDPRGGSVHPLSYARELARVAASLGVRIHARSRATAFEREGGAWTVRTQAGAVRAPRVVVATNGYTDALVPGLQQSVVAANSFQVATAPLSPALSQQILPGRHAVSDTRRLVLYYRKDAQDRLILGGRGQFGEPTGAEDYAHLHKALAALFPALATQPIDYRWSGRVAMTVDRTPHLHEPAPGLLVALGYNGRGIAMATAMGRAIAAHLGGAADALPFPVTSVRTIPFHGLRRAYVGAATAWYMLRDEL